MVRCRRKSAFDLDISEVTVKLHRSGMMKKMWVVSITHLLNASQSLPRGIRLNGSD